MNEIRNGWKHVTELLRFRTGGGYIQPITSPEHLQWVKDNIDHPRWEKVAGYSWIRFRHESDLVFFRMYFSEAGLLDHLLQGSALVEACKSFISALMKAFMFPLLLIAILIISAIGVLKDMLHHLHHRFRKSR